MSVEILCCLIAGLFVGWSIGANDAANSFGTAVGSRVISTKNAIIMICVFGLLGALLEGHRVIDTIGKGIVPLHNLPREQALLIAVAANFSAGFWVLLATYRKLPISTSHAIVGAVAGAGCALHTPVHWEKFGRIFACWILTPLGAAVLAVIVYLFFRHFLIKLIPPRLADPFIRFLLVASSCYVAYSWGANDVANATGVMIGVVSVGPAWLALIGIVAICVGVSTWGYRVMETIGSGITQLVPLMATAAQIASALNVHVYTHFGIPVSTSHSIVSAVLGVGLIHKAHLIRLPVILEIVFSWGVTPFIAAIVSYFLVNLVQFLY